MLRDEDLGLIAQADYGWRADEHLAALTDWIMVTERDAPSYSDAMGWPLPGPWLIDTSFNGPDRLWQAYGIALPKRLSAHHRVGIADAVHLIAAMLAPSSNDCPGCREWLPRLQEGGGDHRGNRTNVRGCVSAIRVADPSPGRSPMSFSAPRRPRYSTH